MHRISIGTLDALFLQMATVIALDLPLPLPAPGAWTIAEADVEADLRDAAIADLLRAGDGRELVTLLRLLRRGDLSRSVHGALTQTIEAAYDAFLQSDPEAWSTIEPPPRLPEPDIAAAVAVLQSLPLPLTQAGSENKSWRRAMDAALAAVRRGDWEQFLRSGPAAKIVEGEDSFSRIPISDEVHQALHPLIAHAAAILLQRWADRNTATRDLLARFHHHYTARKLSAGVLTFTDVPLMLAAADADGRLDELYFRLDARFGHLLLDEFQDTSLPQWRVLAPIAEEILASAGPGTPRSLFCVGDAKQSLYVWRDAAPELLGSLPDRWPQLQKEHLTRSFRSAAPIIETVNRVFGSMRANPALASRPEAVEAATEWTEFFHAQETARDHPGSVALLVAPEPGEDEKQDDANARFAADRVAAIHARAPTATIGVLVRSNKMVAPIISQLRSRGIRASEEGGSPLTDAAPVACALSLLRLADHPGDTAARFHVAHSPLGPVAGVNPSSSEEDVHLAASRIRLSLVRDGYARTLTNWLKDITGSCAPRQYTRFAQLIALAEQYDPRATVRPTDFVRLVEGHRAEDPVAASVRVMTIHKAKGLEFDAVVLPELDGLYTGQTPAIILDRPDPLGPVTAACLYPDQLLQSLDDRLAEIVRRHTVRSIRESLSVLYVAITRAARALEMIVAPNDGLPLSPAGVLRGALAPGAPAAPGCCLYSAGTDAWSDAVESPEHPPALPEIELRLAMPRQRRVLPRTSPSAIAAAARVHAEHLLTLDRGVGAARGTLIHSWFELVGWLDDGVPSDDELLARARRLVTAPGVTPAEALGDFRRMIEAPNLSALLRRSAYPEGGLVLWRERPFAVRLEGPRHEGLLTGRFDRLVVERPGEAAARAHVIDFKTDAISDAGDIDALTDHYAPQLEAYRDAAGRLLGLARARVRATLVFANADILRDISVAE